VDSPRVVDYNHRAELGSSSPERARLRMPKALLVDDDEAFVFGLAEAVKRDGFEVRTAGTLQEARQALHEQEPDALLIDLQLPDGSGLELLQAPEGRLPPGVIFISGNASVELAVEALRLGATDFLTKPVDFARVKMALANLSRTRELRRQVGALRGELRQLGRFGSIVGGSRPMQIVYDLVAKVAATDAAVFVLGETGTGKELVAQTLHDMSRRAKHPFLPINCGAVSPTLIESELFGHEKGSFTGADRSHRGHFERAHEGTLFLDEVTEMPVDLQVKLLRVLETGRVLRVGASEPVQVDVRVIAASNRPPEQAVKEGKLREDLFYRLNVFPIALPPLRAREDDVALLAEHFLEELNKAAKDAPPKAFTKAALDRLRAHGWPGNVRELRNVVQRAFILAPNDIGVDTLPLGVVEERLGTSLLIRVGTPIDEAERRLILATLEHCAGDKKKAAELLKISLKTLYNRLNVYNA
jgi:two-component system, NtrC family, response regulator AtoC